MTAAGWRWAFGLSVAAQLAVLYWPEAGTAPGVPGLDKVAHVAVFGAVAVTGVLAGLPARWLAAALLAHAVVSEAVQGSVLPGRSGDVWDVVADAAGVAAGLLLAARLARPRRPVGARPEEPP